MHSVPDMNLRVRMRCIRSDWQAQRTEMEKANECVRRELNNDLALLHFLMKENLCEQTGELSSSCTSFHSPAESQLTQEISYEGQEPMDAVLSEVEQCIDIPKARIHYDESQNRVGRLLEMLSKETEGFRHYRRVSGHRG